MPAALRPARLTAVNYGGGSTAINGVVGFELEFTAEVITGYSDAAIGQNAAHVTRWNGVGRVILDQFLNAQAVAALAAASSTPLRVLYQALRLVTGTPVSQTMTIDAVSFGTIETWSLPSLDGDGETARFALPFEVVFGTANTTPDGVVAFS